MKNLILCGGVGSRLWPLSRTSLPKQFANLIPGASLFEQTVVRNRPFVSEILVAANQDQSFLAETILRRLGQPLIRGLIEPAGRNTAPAIALVCLGLPADELVLVTPSDHVITNQAAYESAIQSATDLAKTGKLVTFGIKPEYPETGFGYIEADGHRVVSFKEKPDLATAEAYLASGRFWWNSGMFCFTAGHFLAELSAHAPDLLAACRLAHQAAAGTQPLQPSLAAMQAIPALSIDYALMEKSTNVAVVPCSIGWSDLGSLDSLADFLPTDADQNAMAGTSVVMIDSRRNMVIAERQVALIDVEDLLIVDSDDALLICRRGSSQKVKQVYDQLRIKNPAITERFSRLDFPWGSDTLIDRGPGFVIHRLEIEPDCRIEPRQIDHAEQFWQVLDGQLELLLDGQSKTLLPSQAAADRTGQTYQLANRTKRRVIMLETRRSENLESGSAKP